MTELKKRQLGVGKRAYCPQHGFVIILSTRRRRHRTFDEGEGRVWIDVHPHKWPKEKVAQVPENSIIILDEEQEFFARELGKVDYRLKDWAVVQFGQGYSAANVRNRLLMAMKVREDTHPLVDQMQRDAIKGGA